MADAAHEEAILGIFTRPQLLMCKNDHVSGERVAVKTGRPSDLMTELVSFSYLSRVLYPFLFADFIR